jgi:hypothetical protein
MNLVELFLEWGMFQKSRRKNQNTHFVIKNFFFQKSFRLWDNAETYGRTVQAIDDNIIWCMHCACWLPKATDTHSEYVILITYPWQQWLHEGASVLLYTYIACLIFTACEYAFLEDSIWYVCFIVGGNPSKLQTARSIEEDGHDGGKCGVLP